MIETERQRNTVVNWRTYWNRGASRWMSNAVPVPRGQAQYVLKRPRHQGGWERPRVHINAHLDTDSQEERKQQ